MVQAWNLGERVWRVRRVLKARRFWYIHKSCRISTDCRIDPKTIHLKLGCLLLEPQTSYNEDWVCFEDNEQNASLISFYLGCRSVSIEKPKDSHWLKDNHRSKVMDSCSWLSRESQEKNGCNARSQRPCCSCGPWREWWQSAWKCSCNSRTIINSTVTDIKTQSQRARKGGDQDSEHSLCWINCSKSC